MLERAGPLRRFCRYFGRRRRRTVGDRRGECTDRWMRINVLHRYRRQVAALPYPRAELRHHQRVGAEIIKEMAVVRHLVDVEDARQQLGVLGGDGAGRGTSPGLDRDAHRVVSWKKSLRRRSWPAATARSYTHFPTATSRIPMPKGEKMTGLLRSTDLRPRTMSASVPVTKLRFPVNCSVRCGDVFAFMTWSTSSTTFWDRSRISGDK